MLVTAMKEQQPDLIQKDEATASARVYFIVNVRLTIVTAYYTKTLKTIAINMPSVTTASVELTIL